jgi:hypothetical protein
MKGELVRVGVLASLLATTAALAAPAAKGVTIAFTDPTGGNTSNIKITKPSRFQAKLATQAVVFSVKLAGVVDKATGTTPVTQNGNTLTLQIVVNGVTRTPDFFFNLTNGRTDPSRVKFTVPLTDMDVWGSALPAGTPIEIKRVTVTDVTSTEEFGVGGLTTR